MQDKIKKAAPYVLTTAIVVMFSGALYVADYFFGGIIYPETMVANLEVGLEDLDDVRDEIEGVLDDYMEQPVVIVFNDEVYELQPEALGIEFDKDEIFNSIPVFGNYKSLLESVLNAAREGQVALAVSIDEEKLIQALSLIEPETLPQNAYIEIEENGKLMIVEEQAGKKLDEDVLIAELSEKFSKLENSFIALPVVEVDPLVVKADLEPFLDEANAVFDKEVKIYRDGLEWIFYPKEHTDWFAFETVDIIEIPGFEEMFELAWDDEKTEANSSFQIKIDEAKLAAYIDEIAPEIEVAPEDVTILMDEEGVITFEGTGTDGETVNRDVFREMLSMALENGISEFEVPISVTKAGITVPEELEELGVKELVATGYSSFWGSPYYRNLNIGVGLSKFNGVLVEPGESFSFLDTLGDVDYANGYYQELVIKGDETIPEYGGGLCQVSSTMFRAVLNGGLPIDFRKEHSYAVSYYAYPDGYGLDATIYQPWPDLQWTNDTGHYILIQAYAEGSEAYFKFYGTSDGRKVLMDGPYYSNYVGAPADVIEYTTALDPGVTVKKDTAHTGFDVTWYRTILFDDGTEETETIFSHYQAWPAKYQVGIEEGETPSE